MTETSPIPPEHSSDSAPLSRPIWKLVIGICLGLVAAVIVLTIYATNQKHAVTLVVDGNAQTLETHALTVGALLTEQGIVLNPADQVTPPIETALSDGQLIRVERARHVRLVIDGAVTELDTSLSSPAEILENAGIAVQENDRVIVNGTELNTRQLAESTESVSQIVVQHALPFTVIIEPAFEGDGEQFTLHSSAGTVGAALYEADIELFLADVVTPDLATPLTAGMEVVIERAQPITIAVDGATLTTRVLGGTVADAVSSAGVALMGQDFTIPDLATEITSDTFIRVVRVKENLITGTQPLPFTTVYVEDANLNAGTEQVIQEGRNGVEQIVTRVRLEDGEETNQTVIRRTLLVAPQEQIVARAP